MQGRLFLFTSCLSLDYKLSQARFLALAGFEAWVCFVDHIDPTFTADHAAIFMALLKRFQRASDTHGQSPSCILSAKKLRRVPRAIALG